MMFDKSTPPQQQPEASGGATSATAFLGKGAKIVGKISFEGPAQIEGQVEGEITARDTLTIGRTATVQASVKGATVIVHGRVTGNVEATTRLELHPPSRIDGDVTTPKLVVHEGALLNGRCTMDAAAKPGATIGVEPVPVAQPAGAAAPQEAAKAR